MTSPLDNPVPPGKPLSSAAAIALARGWMTASTLINALLGVLLVVAWMVGGNWAFVLVALVWFALLVLSSRGVRLAFEGGAHLAAGDFEQAEQQLGRSIRSFSLIRSAKLIGLQQMAILRHAQKRWDESAALAAELLARRRRRDQHLDTPSRLLLADSLLELGDIAAADLQLTHLRGRSLDLHELITLTVLRLDLQSRLSAWDAMLVGFDQCVGLAEIMPVTLSSRVQAMLALAASKLGQSHRADWLKRRVELLIDPAELCRHRPVLRGVWAG